MTMTDPISDLLTRIRNASGIGRLTVEIPWSRIKEQICRVLVAEGFAAEVSVTGAGPARRISLVLGYTEAGEPVITGLRRVSRPSLRVYRPAAEAPTVRAGLGISIISTPEGLVVDREAKQRGVGGEVLCEVW